MNALDQRKRPATLGSANRANIVQKQALSNIEAAQTEGEFVAAYVARRYRLPLPLARLVACLANLGGALS